MPYNIFCCNNFPLSCGNSCALQAQPIWGCFLVASSYDLQLGKQHTLFTVPQLWTPTKKKLCSCPFLDGSMKLVHTRKALFPLSSTGEKTTLYSSGSNKLIVTIDNRYTLYFKSSSLIGFYCATKSRVNKKKSIRHPFNIWYRFSMAFICGYT